MADYKNELIFGMDPTERIVSIEKKDQDVVVFIEEQNGEIREEYGDFYYWIATPKSLGAGTERLEGDLYYKYVKTFNDYESFKQAKSYLYRKQINYYTSYDLKESVMLTQGMTYYKGMRAEEVSVLSFDIETDGLVKHKNSEVYFISNTYRLGKKIIRKLFSFDEYPDTKTMIDAWCDWVRKVNPSIILNHNILGYDLPYLAHVASLNKTKLNIGRDGSEIKFNTYTSSFRKDGSQSYEYNNALVYGREIIDTLFLSIKYDIGRKYESYGLKQIIKQEGLEKKDRQHYDASKIKSMLKNPEELKKIKKYAIDDADDALKLFDLMIPSFFYYTQSIPRSLQHIINSATGSQINSFMVRAYLQEFHSLPKTSESQKYEGAISWGNPGIYNNVYKIDVASLYPSIMRQYKVYNKEKDPKKYFLETVEYFTKERLKNKKLGQETKNRYYKDLEQSQKIIINSTYGFLGAEGLLFNSPKHAAFITRKGRQILEQSIWWATGKTYKDWNKDTPFQKKQFDIATNNQFTLVNCDTDSISFCKSNQSKFTQDEQQRLLAELNSHMPELIIWEDDGIYNSVVVIKAKNYVLFDGKKIKIKGSALKATTKEKALQSFIKTIIDCLLTGKKDRVIFEYNEFAKLIQNGIGDINNWCTKKTITDKILNPERTNEQKVYDAINGRYVQEGDKIYVYFKEDSSLALAEDFDGTYNKDALFKKLYSTLKVFSNVLDIDMIPNYQLKKNKEMLDIITNKW